MLSILINVLISLLDHIADGICYKHEKKKILILRILARSLVVLVIAILYFEPLIGENL
jgi:hypothetical protein